MPRWRQQPEEQPELYNDVYVWPWEEEVFSTAEYTRSLQGLDRFLTAVDIANLHTLDDLSAVASLVGHDLRVVTIVKGAKIEKKTYVFEDAREEPVSNIDTHYVLTTWKRDLEIMVTADDDYVLISEKSLIGFQLYHRESLRVKLPSNRDITIGGYPNVDELDIYALDLRSSYMREYHPVREPNNPNVQQGFGYLLRDALLDVKNLILSSR